MDEPRVVELPSYHVAKLRYQGPGPPHPGLFEHWQRFHSTVDLLQLKSLVPDVVAVGFAPPGLAASQLLLYDACIPVPSDLKPEQLSGLELGDIPGGPFILCAGPITKLPLLLQAARRYAMSHGIAIERGRIEVYLPETDDMGVAVVDVGYRIHDTDIEVS